MSEAVLYTALQKGFVCFEIFVEMVEKVWMVEPQPSKLSQPSQPCYTICTKLVAVECNSFFHRPHRFS
jgi:hypothetical protein